MLSSGLLYIIAAVIVIGCISGVELVFLKKNRTHHQQPFNQNLPAPPPPMYNEQAFATIMPEVKPTVEITKQQTLNKKKGSIFISHTESDAAVALEIARGLEDAGYKTWYFERDSLPGVSYLVLTCSEIESSQAVVVIISPASLESNQMTLEIVRAHETGKPFIPVLRGITHKELKAQHKEWAEALGATSSVLIPVDGTLAVMPKIIGGLKQLGVTNSSSTS